MNAKPINVARQLVADRRASYEGDALRRRLRRLSRRPVYEVPVRESRSEARVPAPPSGPMLEGLRPSVGEGGPPTILSYAGPAAAELGRLVSELAEPGPSPSVEPAGGATRLFEVVLGLLERLAADRPVLLIIEDL